MIRAQIAALIVVLSVSTQVFAMPVFPWQPITATPYDPAEGCLYGGERYDEGEVIDPLLSPPHQCVLKPVDSNPDIPGGSAESTEPLFLFWEELEDE